MDFRRHNRKTLGVRRTVCLLALLVSLSADALSANELRGTVRNQTRGRPAAGDEVILLRLDQGAQEEARTRTDARGEFTISVPYSDKSHVVRVVHQGTSYDRPAAASGVVSVDVYDVARRVRNVTGTIEILRVGTNGKLLHVSDFYEIKNDSLPPVTQAGERTFQVYLPAEAEIDSVLAAGPDSSAAMISAAPVPGEAGHYTVNFPLLPGATRFAFNYNLPYQGHAAFQIRREYPLQQLAVMIPVTMKFSSNSPAFDTLATQDKGYQVHAVNGLSMSPGLEFEVSGKGALSAIVDQGQSAIQPATTNHRESLVAADLSALSKSHRGPIEGSSQSLVLGFVTAALLAVCGLLILQGRRTPSRNRP